MDTSKMREQFEKAYVEEMALCCGQDIRQRAKANLEWRQENGDYRDPMVRLAYWAWQASREAVVVDLSDLSRCFSPNDCGDWAMWLDDVKKLIEAQGLKVAP